MKNIGCIIMTIWFIVSSFTSSVQLNAEEVAKLNIFTEEYPPLSFLENGMITGLSTEIVREIMHRNGRDDEIHLVKWDKGYKAVLEEPNTVLFSTAMTSERKDKLQWVGPIAALSTNLYAVKKSGLKIANLDEAKKVYKIATVKDYYSEQVLIQEGFTNLDSSVDEATALGKLFNWETELLVSTNTTMPIMLQKIGAQTDDLESVFTLSTDLIYIAFSLQTSPDIVAGWQTTLNEMKQDGTFTKIYSKWLPSETLPGIIQMITEEYPPITFMKDGKPSGFVTDMVREIALRLEIPDNINLTSWKNAYNMALVHPNVVLFSAERTQERENLFKWVGPVGKNSSILYAKKGSGLKIKNLKEAKKVAAIATTTDWFTEQYLKSEGFTNLISSPAPTNNVKQLMNGEVQLSIFTDVTIPEIVSQAGYSMNDLEPVFTVTQTYFYIALSKDTSDEVVHVWQSTLGDLKEDGTFEKIYRGYLPNVNLQDLLKH
ncbi:MAG: transporter substrate-binding domain-containing protein [Candidatus Cloacimonadales bacterium]|nr:transporter substrate-binding domain-containing protein [Candidatus Cloacimonadales bacterium]